jgi:hypothetical protein
MAAFTVAAILKSNMVGLMAAIFKFKMAAARVRFLSGTRPEMNRRTIKYLCAKFGAVIPICTILFIFDT